MDRRSLVHGVAAAGIVGIAATGEGRAQNREPCDQLGTESGHGLRRCAIDTDEVAALRI